MTTKIFLKLIAAGLVVLVCALVMVDIVGLRVIETNYYETLEKMMAEKAHTVASVAGQRSIQELAEATQARVTLIGRDGQVLGDSARTDVAENHGTRPEIQAALAGRQGSAFRRSATTGINMLYVAIPIETGALRVALPLEAIETQIASIRKRVVVATGASFLPALLLAALFARSVSGKLGAIIDYAAELAQGKFSARLAKQGNDELGLLGRKLSETGEKLQAATVALEREHAELEKVERVRKDFVINVSHELRTPLASIQGYTETLLDGAIHEPGTNIRFLNIIRQNAERLTNLAGDLLTLSRIELKTQKFQFASYYVNELLNDCVDSVRPMADKKHLKLRIEPGPEGAEVFCDSKAVHQLLGNLLDNAIKYTPEHHQIVVSAAAAKPNAAGHEFVEFAVKDSGNGIAPDELPRLFERFYRVDKARSRELGGTGLGLAIVKHLAKAHGGDVGVTSELGNGARFYFTLPVQDLGLSADVELQGQLTAL